MFDREVPIEVTRCPFCDYNPVLAPSTTPIQMQIALLMLNAHLLVHIVKNTATEGK